MPPVSTPRLRLALRATLIAFAALAFVLATGLLDGAPGVRPLALLTAPWAPLANALPGGLLLGALLLACTRRLALSWLLAFAAEALLYRANALKFENLATPLLPADFRMLGQLHHGGAHLLGSYAQIGWPLFAALALGTIAIVLLAWREPPWFTRRAWPRIGLAACAFAAIASLASGWTAWRVVYTPDRLHFEPWSAEHTARHSGLVGMLGLFRLQYAGKHTKIDVPAAHRLIAENEPALRAQLAGDSGVHPDIVIVQSESFFDPGRMRGYADGALAPNFARLAQTGESGALHVPTFGGGTIRTEFEVLTGLPLRYFPQVQFPYLQINAQVIPGLARTLRANGYSTLAIHDNDAGFWNRASALRRLGFDRFIAIDGFPKNPPHDGRYVADRVLTDEILSQLRDSGPPQFVLAISMEAHGPYDGDPGKIDVAGRDAIPVPPGVTGTAKVMLQNYLYHLRHADHELGRLAAALAQRQRPTLLLFYGDHLPALGQAFEVNGFKDGGDQLAQTGSWLLIDPAHPQSAPSKDLAAWALPGELLARAGIRDDAWFALTDVLAPQLSTLTRAPDAQPAPETAQQRELDNGMANAARLRLKGGFDGLLPKSVLPADTGYARVQRMQHGAVAAGAHQ